MEGWIVYNRERYRPNAAYARLYEQWARAHGTRITLKMQETLRLEQERPLPDFAIFRCEAPDVRRALERAGCVVSNGSRLGALGYDKLSAYEFVAGLGLPYLSVEPLGTCDAMPRLVPPFVVKPRCGHGGQGVSLVRSAEEFRRYCAREVRGGDPTKWLVQECGPQPGKDLRVYVMGRRVLAAMLRTGARHELRSNYSLGGTAQVWELSRAERDSVQVLMDAFGEGYYGIDFLFDEDGGLLFNEVEDIVGSRMLFDHTTIDVVDEHMKLVTELVRARGGRVAND